MSPTSFPKAKIKVLLLEGIHAFAEKTFEESGYVSVTCLDKSLSEAELCDRVKDVHILGIRSKTNISEKVLDSANNLLALGCFCIGTNQVKLQHAELNGVPVFNAPFSNTRSVAEITMAAVIMLARRAFQRSMQLHQGVWQKSAAGSHEVRKKTIGVVGYGHIGPQVGLLAEAFGMNVVYYDISRKLPLGNASQLDCLDDLLKISDFVSLHVPETDETQSLIGKQQFKLMKPGACLVNFSRGSVVDIDALADAVETGHLGGAAVDVYPQEPSSNKETFKSRLQNLPNVILTPHIGGSTVEAQENIAREVASALVDFIESGSTGSAVNFPNLDIPMQSESHRVLNIHQNVPGVLREINSIVAEMDVNINAQYLATTQSIGYLVMDVSANISREVKKAIEGLDTNIRTRLLF